MATRLNLKKYIAIDGGWRFVPVLKVNGKHRPEAVLIDGEAKKGINGTPTSYKTRRVPVPLHLIEGAAQIQRSQQNNQQP
jgi:hypothetical protein